MGKNNCLVESKPCRVVPLSNTLMQINNNIEPLAIFCGCADCFVLALIRIEEGVACNVAYCNELIGFLTFKNTIKETSFVDKLNRFLIRGSLLISREKSLKANIKRSIFNKAIRYCVLFSACQ